MEGDLNLSQALGGLRIANNPDTPPQSPRQTPVSSSSSVKESDGPRSQAPSSLRQEVRDEDNTSTSIGQVSTRSIPNYDLSPDDRDRDTVRRYDLQDGASRQPDYPPSNPVRNSYAPMPTNRHSTQYPPTPYQPSSYQNHGQNVYPDYNRISREPSRSSVSGAPRGPPRDQRPVPDRTYRQSAPIGHFAPPRGSSRGMGQPPNGGYVENGPLPSSEEWKERGAAITYRKEVDQNGKPITRVVKKGVKDFTFGRTLGEGSYSTVLAATDRTTLREYAVKVLDKVHIIKENKVKYVNIEKDTLNRLGDHPGIVKLYYTFQDERNLYFVLDLAAGGELLGFLKKIGSFDEECTRYYGAQILDAIEYMHSRGVIHRDLKPENVLLDEHMHVKITDFGTAKILNQPKKASPTSPHPSENQPSFDPSDGPNGADTRDRANSFVGTAEYVSPELLTEKSACKASDLWAFGCIIYQLLAGRPPFKAANEYLTFQKIVNLEYEFPRGFPLLARDLVDRLLVLDPTKRLMIEHVKDHPFFAGIEWGRRLWKQKAPRLKAYIPPPPEEKIIKLNDFSTPPPIGGFRNGIPTNNGSSQSLARPQPPLRVITELPPPSQLDIEWSPVLTRPNERILKLGNCMVQSSHSSSQDSSKSSLNGSSSSEPNKLARFFSAVGSNTRRRQRLVMITSSARIIIAQAGGEEKRIKSEIPLLAPGVSVRNVGGSPEGRIWAVETKDKRYTFEATDSSSAWLDAIDRAKQYAIAFPADTADRSNMSSPTGTINDEKRERRDEEREKKNAKRFSRRASKHGLAAVF